MMDVSVESVAAAGTDVDVLRIGPARIYRLPDIEKIAWPAVALFRDLVPDRLHALAGRVPRGTLDTDTNSLVISFNSHIIAMPGLVALVDAGVGNDKERPDRPAWHRRSGRFLEAMTQLGFHPDGFDIVVNTHFHADHVGWNTVRSGTDWRPTFRNARYVVPQGEWDHWSRLHHAGPAKPILHGAFEDSILPLKAAGVLDVVPSDHEIVPGLHFEPAFGHSPGMCVLRLETGGHTVLFTADVLHHPFQLAERRMVSNFCADPDRARATREALLTRHAGTGTILAPYHFPRPSFGRIAPAGADFQFAPLVRG